MLKIGQKIKAKWDGATSEIVAIKDGIVTYKCYSYENRHLSIDDNYNDGLFRDTEDVILEHFTFL
jgi:hypothetical protein